VALDTAAFMACGVSGFGGGGFVKAGSRRAIAVSAEAMARARRLEAEAHASADKDFAKLVTEDGGADDFLGVPALAHDGAASATAARVPVVASPQSSGVPPVEASGIPSPTTVPEPITGASPSVPMSCPSQCQPLPSTSALISTPPAAPPQPEHPSAAPATASFATAGRLTRIGAKRGPPPLRSGSRGEGPEEDPAARARRVRAALEADLAGDPGGDIAVAFGGLMESLGMTSLPRPPSQSHRATIDAAHDTLNAEAGCSGSTTGPLPAPPSTPAALSLAGSRSTTSSAEPALSMGFALAGSGRAVTVSARAMVRARLLESEAHADADKDFARLDIDEDIFLKSSAPDPTASAPSSSVASSLDKVPTASPAEPPTAHVTSFHDASPTECAAAADLVRASGTVSAGVASEHEASEARAVAAALDGFDTVITGLGFAKAGSRQKVIVSAESLARARRLQAEAHAADRDFAASKPPPPTMPQSGKGVPSESTLTSSSTRLDTEDVMFVPPPPAHTAENQRTGGRPLTPPIPAASLETPATALPTRHPATVPPCSTPPPQQQTSAGNVARRMHPRPFRRPAPLGRPPHSADASTTTITVPTTFPDAYECTGAAEAIKLSGVSAGTAPIAATLPVAMPGPAPTATAARETTAPSTSPRKVCAHKPDSPPRVGPPPLPRSQLVAVPGTAAHVRTRFRSGALLHDDIDDAEEEEQAGPPEGRPGGTGSDGTSSSSSDCAGADTDGRGNAKAQVDAATVICRPVPQRAATTGDGSADAPPALAATDGRRPGSAGTSEDGEEALRFVAALLPVLPEEEPTTTPHSPGPPPPPPPADAVPVNVGFCTAGSKRSLRPSAQAMARALRLYAEVNAEEERTGAGDYNAPEKLLAAQTASSPTGGSTTSAMSPDLASACSTSGRAATGASNIVAANSRNSQSLCAPPLQPIPVLSTPTFMPSPAHAPAVLPVPELAAPAAGMGFCTAGSKRALRPSDQALARALRLQTEAHASADRDFAGHGTHGGENDDDDSFGLALRAPATTAVRTRPELPEEASPGASSSLGPPSETAVTSAPPDASCVVPGIGHVRNNDKDETAGYAEPFDQLPAVPRQQLITTPKSVSHAQSPTSGDGTARPVDLPLGPVPGTPVVSFTLAGSGRAVAVSEQSMAHALRLQAEAHASADAYYAAHSTDEKGDDAEAITSELARSFHGNVGLSPKQDAPLAPATSAGGMPARMPARRPPPLEVPRRHSPVFRAPRPCAAAHVLIDAADSAAVPTTAPPAGCADPIVPSPSPHTTLTRALSTGAPQPPATAVRPLPPPSPALPITPSTSLSASKARVSAFPPSAFTSPVSTLQPALPVVATTAATANVRRQAHSASPRLAERRAPGFTASAPETTPEPPASIPTSMLSSDLLLPIAKAAAPAAAATAAAMASSRFRRLRHAAAAAESPPCQPPIASAFASSTSPATASPPPQPGRGHSMQRPPPSPPTHSPLPSATHSCVSTPIAPGPSMAPAVPAVSLRPPSPLTQPHSLNTARPPPTQPLPPVGAMPPSVAHGVDALLATIAPVQTPPSALASLFGNFSSSSAAAAASAAASASRAPPPLGLGAPLAGPLSSCWPGTSPADGLDALLQNARWLGRVHAVTQAVRRDARQRKPTTIVPPEQRADAAGTSRADSGSDGSDGEIVAVPVPPEAASLSPPLSSGAGSARDDGAGGGNIIRVRRVGIAELRRREEALGPRPVRGDYGELVMLNVSVPAFAFSWCRGRGMTT